MTEAQLQHPLLLPLHQSILFLSLLLPPFRLRRPLFITLIACTFIPLAARPISSDFLQAYGAATLWVWTLRVLTIHVFHPVPESSLYRPGIELPGAAASYPLLKKIDWVWSLLISQRDVGWNTQRSSIPTIAGRQYYLSRKAYVAHAAKWMVTIYLLLDVSRLYTLTQPYVHAHDDPRFLRIGDPSRKISLRVLDMLSNAVSASGFIQLQYLLCSVVAILFFGGKPENWPPLFGDLTDLWCLQNLWGRVWHQMLRGSLMPWGKAVGDVFRLKGWPRLATIVFVGFGISAVGHAIAIRTVGSGSGGGGAVRFFMSQALVIVVEDLARRTYVAARGTVGEREMRWWKVVGFLWVVACGTYTCPMQADEMGDIGVFRAEPLPWSLTRWVLGWEQKL